MKNSPRRYDDFSDRVAGAATVLMILYILGRFVVEYFVHPPRFRYLASALGLGIGDGHYTLFLHVGYFVTISLLVGSAYYIGGELLETSDDSR